MGDSGQLQVVDVVAEVVGYRSNERGLAGARWAMQKVPALPCTTSTAVELAARRECIEISEEAGLEWGIESERCKRSRVTEGNRGPRR